MKQIFMILLAGLIASGCTYSPEKIQPGGAVIFLDQMGRTELKVFLDKEPAPIMREFVIEGAKSLEALVTVQNPNAYVFSVWVDFVFDGQSHWVKVGEEQFRKEFRINLLPGLIPRDRAVSVTARIWLNQNHKHLQARLVGGEIIYKVK